MSEITERYHRRSIRLDGYDYSQSGAYFVTLCTYRREFLFGEISDSAMQLNTFGEIVKDEWLKTAEIRPYVVLDEFVVMPNHFHAVLFLMNDENKSVLPNQSAAANVGARRGGDQLSSSDPVFVGATCQVAPTPPRGPKSGSIGAIIGQFKRKATIRINEARATPGDSVWQRNYYEHVIRNESVLNDVRLYIQINPAQWTEDHENPANFSLLGNGVKLA